MKKKQTMGSNYASVLIPDKLLHIYDERGIKLGQADYITVANRHIDASEYLNTMKN